MYVVADFVALKTIEEYKEKIAQKIAHLDIGVVALNAGYADMGPFHKIDDIEVEKQCQVNAVHPLYLLKVMISQLVQRYELRKLKSAVVITSSIAGQYDFPGVATYSSVKAMVTHLAKCLNYEFKGKIDIMSYNPGMVTTKMSNAKQTSMKTISEDRSAQVAFQDIGYMDETSGSLRHDWRRILNNNWPVFLVKREMMNNSWIIYDRIQKRKAAK